MNASTDNAIICTIDAVRSRASTQETLLTLAVPTEHSARISSFLGKIGQQVAVAFAEVGTTGHVKSQNHYGEEAKALKLSGFFRAPKVWQAVGTDADYRRWIQKQKSALTDQYSEWVDGEGRCIAAHVRRAGESGTGYKAEYACVPLTDAEHKAQHHKGENAIANQDWFDAKRIEYVERWGWETLKKDLGFRHWYETPPTVLYSWAMDHGVAEYLPAVYKETKQ